ncbi:hypothetical protein [Microcoleus sp. PH2017_27_LUM_O_A]|uniref:hypothetical protein n=1 Tax=Microcoleus sp. PH2017_27_LUM_O_A TaxID=2798837 RepID=UPI0025E6E34D|nr:hypothetical protein [Microcoleus sp. PH2017_27_LUM_O_A]
MPFFTHFLQRVGQSQTKIVQHIASKGFGDSIASKTVRSIDRERYKKMKRYLDRATLPVALSAIATIVPS